MPAFGIMGSGEMDRASEKTVKMLFIGNSATYVHDIPQTLGLLAGKAGYPVETKTIAKGRRQNRFGGLALPAQ